MHVTVQSKSNVHSPWTTSPSLNTECHKYVGYSFANLCNIMFFVAELCNLHSCTKSSVFQKLIRYAVRSMTCSSVVEVLQ